MSKETRPYEEISHLATRGRPGALLVAEQSIDRHLAVLTSDKDRIDYLDSLSRDLYSLGESKPELVQFLKQMQNYVDSVREELTA